MRPLRHRCVARQLSPPPHDARGAGWTARRRGDDAGVRILLFLGLLALAACGGAPRRDLAPQEAELVAWWCEDVARGHARSAGELRTEDASAALERVATWAVTRSSIGDLPQQLATRRARWPVVRSLLKQGLLVLVEPGLVAVRPDASADERSLAQPVADSENQERRFLEALVLSLAQPDGVITRRYRAALRAARLELDQAVGGRLWTGPAAPR